MLSMYNVIFKVSPEFVLVFSVITTNILNTPPNFAKAKQDAATAIKITTQLMLSH